MLGIMNHVIRTATRRQEGGLTPFDRPTEGRTDEPRRRHAEELALHRHLRRGWPLL